MIFFFVLGKGESRGPGLSRPDVCEFRGHHRKLPQDVDGMPASRQGAETQGRREEDRHNGGVAQRGHHTLRHREDEGDRRRARG